MVICLSLLHRAAHFGSLQVNALLGEDSDHRPSLPSLFYSVRYVWVQRRSSSPLKQPLDRHPIRLAFSSVPSHPLAIIDTMKVTDGEYEEMVWMDGRLVQLRQSSQREDINIYLYVFFLKDI